MDDWDVYFWPNSDVLKNRSGITSEEALRSFEHEASRRRTMELRERPVEGNFDTAHFREIHRRLFLDVYDWAGRYRTVDMIKDRTSFAPVATKTHTLETWGEKILNDLKAENHLKGLKAAAFVDRLTYHYGEINYWHPHRDGNGRVTKEFLAQLGKEAGYQIEFHRISATAWNAAAGQRASGDPRMAREVFEKVRTPSRAIAFRDEHILDAVKRFPELQGAVNASTRQNAKPKPNSRRPINGSS
jgi:cell filamentation protein